MLAIKPYIQHKSICPYCKSTLGQKAVLWQGMHICVELYCSCCNVELIEDLRVGHSVFHPLQIDLSRNIIFGEVTRKAWLGEPLLQSLKEPQAESVEITREVFKSCDRVIILNCIDSLYGHCLLKLLNAQKHLDQNPEYGLVVIVQSFLRWMIPVGVAEIWTLKISLRKGSQYFPSFHRFALQESRRFKEIYVSAANSHPSQFHITRFTQVPLHDFHKAQYRITFIWREDRLWLSSLLAKVLIKLNLSSLALKLQNQKVCRLFKNLRKSYPNAVFTIAGLGQKFHTPGWIEDFRVAEFDEFTERKLCHVYADSRLVVGVHGSNMLLPSGHAGMTIDLMPPDRWGNFAQDILYHESDPRLASFRYRYLPLNTSVSTLAYIAYSMLAEYYQYQLQMTADLPEAF
jgi:hypothetical protein